MPKQFSAKQDVRVAAARVLHQMFTGGGSLSRLLPVAQESVDPEDRALLQALCFGVARWSGQLTGIVDQLLEKPLRKKDMDVYRLLQLGVYQLMHMRMAQHAAVDTTVSAAKKLGKPWARGLVNGVLRNYLRQPEELLENIDAAANLSRPEWFVDSIKKDWPYEWRSIVNEGNQQAPMTLRVNTKKTSLADYAKQLHEVNIQSKPIDGSPVALVLPTPVQVSALPGFADGFVSVQDAAAQFAGPLLGNGKDKRLLDACAAPGGKTAHAIEFGEWQHVTALDVDGERLKKVEETLQRLQLSDRAIVKTGAAEKTDDWWDAEPFDAILLDAPCSGTGVIRRHPDIKWLRRADDIDALVVLQSTLLNKLWVTLKPGGQLLYATLF